VRGNERGTHWVFGLSLVQVMLMLVFAVVLVYVADNGEGRGQEPDQGTEETNVQGETLLSRLETAAERNNDLEKQLGAMTGLVDELTVMVGAKVPSKDGFREAIDTLKRGYSLCQKDDNTLIEARIQNGAETVQVIGEIPSDLFVNLAKGDETSDLDQIVSFIQDVYDYEKDHKCRFNYRLKYTTDNDYRKAREGYEKYFYPEKLAKTG
jgi:hypothetical protein